KAESAVNQIRRLGNFVWVCTDKGICFFDEAGKYTEIDAPMNNSVDRMMCDYEGNLWFTSSRQGVMKIVENRFTDITKAMELENWVVNSTCKYGDDLYVGTDDGLYLLGADGTLKTNAIVEQLSSTRIRCVKGIEDKLWICTNNGLFCYDPDADTYQHWGAGADGGLASNTVRMIIRLSDGSMAAATSNGLNIIKDGVVVKTYNGTTHEAIGNSTILTVIEGEGGKLYLGSNGGGIYVIDGDNVSAIGLENGLQSGVIMRIKKDPVANLYWLITSNSIAYMQDGKITTLQNFPYSNNLDIYFDSQERAWVLSSNGIYVVNRTDMLADGQMTYTLYDSKYGLPGINTANSHSYLDEDGTLYVAASTGIYSVNINQRTNSVGKIKIDVPFIQTDDATIWLRGEETIHIPSNCKRLNIYANAFTYSMNNPYLNYWLEGFDEGPIQTTKQHMTYATYTNLMGGTYRFHFSVVGEEENEVVITIIKDSAFYEQLWFIIFAGMAGTGLIAAIIALYFRGKTKKLQRKWEENRKLVNEMTRVFSSCIDMKDSYTNGHSARVAKYTAMMAKKMGKKKDEVEQIYNIALLHDIGKIGVPDKILNKPGRLDNDEYTIMKSHSPTGYEILKNIDIAPDIALGAGYHHERYDGTGYPKGLKGEEIPEVAQIIAVADAFDAMYSTRPYRRKLPLSEAAAEIKRCSGTQFSPRIVDIFLQLVEEGAFDNVESE
ncbi:MAG: HD domain-containing protein, partial [Clostridia bacterium]|nr:HD domain-containing protein [Clostridia bacterium]